MILSKIKTTINLKKNKLKLVYAPISTSKKMDVRVPDDYTTERVVTTEPVAPPSNEDMMEIAIYESIQELRLQRDSKRLLFSSILQKTRRIGFYDNEIKELHPILENLIQEYCEGGMVTGKDYILKTIKKIRLTPRESQYIHSLFD